MFDLGVFHPLYDVSKLNLFTVNDIMVRCGDIEDFMVEYSLEKSCVYNPERRLFEEYESMKKFNRKFVDRIIDRLLDFEEIYDTAAIEYSRIQEGDATRDEKAQSTRNMVRVNNINKFVKKLITELSTGNKYRDIFKYIPVWMCPDINNRFIEKALYLLPIKGGRVIDVSSGRAVTRERVREDFLNWEFPYGPEESTPEDDAQFQQLLRDIFLVTDEDRKNQEVIDFLQVWFGYTLTGLMDAQKCLVFAGGSGSGKTILLKIASKAMGQVAGIGDNSLFYRSVRARTSPASGSPTPHLIRIGGKRLLYSYDVDANMIVDINSVIGIMSGERWGRAPYRDERRIRLVCKLILCQKPPYPIVPDGNHLDRRFIYVKFPAKFIEDPIYPHERKRIMDIDYDAHARAFFRWALQGLNIFLERGLTIPKVVQDGTDDSMYIARATSCNPRTI